MRKILDQMFFWSGIPIGIVVGAYTGFVVSIVVMGGLDWAIHYVFAR